MTDPTVDTAAGAPGPPGRPEIPGERRLAHPPSDRYRSPGPASPADDATGSVARGTAFGVGAATGGALLITLLGGVLAISSGPLVVAGAAGWAVASGLRWGAGPKLAPGRRMRVALGLVLLSVVLGQLGLWLYSRTEGGVLGPVEYLVEVFGILVPLQLLVGLAVAWLAAR